MKLVETYSYTGCNAAGGPWADVIAEGVTPAELIPRIRRWCDDIQRRVAHMEPPRDPGAWRFTRKPQYICIPGGEFSVAVQTVGNRWEVTEYYGQGELYRLTCEKEEENNMSIINTHGLTLNNIEAASQATTDWPQGSGGYNQIAYNRKSGEIIVSEHVGETWTEYDDPDIVRICDTTIHLSAQRIADIIHEAIKAR